MLSLTHVLNSIRGTTTATSVTSKVCSNCLLFIFSAYLSIIGTRKTSSFQTSSWRVPYKWSKTIVGCKACRRRCHFRFSCKL
jgi:hypothetical protein